MSSELCKYSYIWQIHSLHFMFADISVSVCEQNLSYVFLCWGEKFASNCTKTEGIKNWCIHSPILGFFTYFRSWVHSAHAICWEDLDWGRGSVALWLCGSVGEDLGTSWAVRKRSGVKSGKNCRPDCYASGQHIVSNPPMKHSPL